MEPPEQHDSTKEAPSASEGDVAFETLLSRLTDIVGELERGDASLERSLVLFEEGVRLARAGAGRLDRAEARVEELLGRELRTVDLQPDAKRGSSVTPKESR